jgi:hypothetical protein
MFGEIAVSFAARSNARPRECCGVGRRRIELGEEPVGDRGVAALGARMILPARWSVTKGR